MNTSEGRKRILLIELIPDLIKKCASLMAESANADELRRQMASILAADAQRSCKTA